MVEKIYNWDFRPPDVPGRLDSKGNQISFPDAINIKGPVDNEWVEGNATVYLDKEKDEYHVGIYVWSGAVRWAAKETLEKHLGLELEWINYGGGNGHEGGILKIKE